MLLNCPYNTLFYCKTTDDSSQGNDSTSLLQYYSSSRNASKRSVPYVISVMIPPPSHSIFTVMPQNWTPAFLPDFALQYACCSYCKTDRAYFSTCMAVSYISYNMQLLLPGTFCYAFMNAIISYFIISNCCSFSAYMPPSLSCSYVLLLYIELLKRLSIFLQDKSKNNWYYDEERNVVKDFLVSF